MRAGSQGPSAGFGEAEAGDPAGAGELHLLVVRAGRIDSIRRVLERYGFQVEALGGARSGMLLADLPAAGKILRVGSLVVDVERREVRVDERSVDCTPTEFALLARLAAHPGQVLSRAQLLEHVHGAAHFGTERTVDSHIRNLRRKLRARSGADVAASSAPTVVPSIVTVFGIGYKISGASGRARSVRLVGWSAEDRTG
jgi:DNA-binding response OmpR family regulator